MKKIYHLGTCSTCQRIIQELDLSDDVQRQDIKTESMTPEQVDHLAGLAGSYEALFSRRAMKYRAMGLHQQTLSEQDYRQHILKEYTFLSRPVIVVNDQVFVGNSKKTVAAAAAALASA